MAVCSSFNILMTNSTASSSCQFVHCAWVYIVHAINRIRSLSFITIEEHPDVRHRPFMMANTGKHPHMIDSRYSPSDVLASFVN